MSDAPLVHVERRDDGVAVLRLDNPKVNALSMALLGQLERAAESLRDDPPGAVVVTGGDRLFAAGAEISEFRSTDDPTKVVSHDDAARLGQHFLSALNAVADIPRATIAAISGFALGGGCELALACDFRMASEKAKLGQPEILLGIIPGGGGTQRLPRLIGPARAKDLIFSGRQVGAEEALAIGLVDEVVPHEELFDRAMAKAAELRVGRDGRAGPGQAGHRPRPRHHAQRWPRPRAAALRRGLHDRATPASASSRSWRTAPARPSSGGSGR